MSRLLLTVCIAVLLAGFGWAQTTSTDTSDPMNLDGKSPLENVGAYAGRAPSTWVRAALARHGELIDMRVNGPAAGQQPTLPQGTSSSSSSSSSSMGSLGSLMGGGGGGGLAE